MKSGAKRPDWTLFAKITQHMETVLFREKFADWPDYSRLIKLSKKSDDKDDEKKETCVSLKKFIQFILHLLIKVYKINLKILDRLVNRNKCIQSRRIV